MTETKIEFAVQMSGEKCAESIRKCLEGCGKLDVDVKEGRIVIESKLPWVEIQEKIEHTGRRAVLSGFGGRSAVAMINNDVKNVHGVIRFTALAGSNSAGCVIDGVIDGLDADNKHKLYIYECGDLSEGCKNLGDVYNINGNVTGSLGEVSPDSNGRTAFKFTNTALPISDIIGRSFAVQQENTGTNLACGIIARSAGIFQNYKKICACDGVTLWDERDRPIAGAARRQD